MKKYILLAGAALAFAAPAYADSTIKFVDTKGVEIGTGVLSETDAGVKIDLKLHDAAPGVHAIHFHTKGDCSPAETFENAGGHLNIAGHEHGKLSEKGEHEGDMDNIEVAKDGTAQTTIMNDHVTLGADNKDGKAALLDADGSALIIHGGEDDYKSQPAGNAGSRFACAVVK